MSEILSDTEMEAKEGESGKERRKDKEKDGRRDKDRVTKKDRERNKRRGKRWDVESDTTNWRRAKWAKMETKIII